MANYTDCVLRKDLHGVKEGSFLCYGLTDTICTSGVKCPFYASSKTHYRDNKTGYIHRKKGAKTK